MTIYDTVIDEKLTRFLSTAPSYRLGVVRAVAGRCDERELNVGKVLAKQISGLDRGNEMRFQMEVEDYLNKDVKEYSFEDERFGKTVILSNPGILFESALGINVPAFLRRISRNSLVILIWPGVATGEKLCFLSESSELCIKQTEINYFTI